MRIYYLWCRWRWRTVCVCLCSYVVYTTRFFVFFCGGHYYSSYYNCHNAAASRLPLFLCAQRNITNYFEIHCITWNKCNKLYAGNKLESNNNCFGLFQYGKIQFLDWNYLSFHLNHRTIFLFARFYFFPCTFAFLPPIVSSHASRLPFASC